MDIGLIEGHFLTVEKAIAKKICGIVRAFKEFVVDNLGFPKGNDRIDFDLSIGISKDMDRKGE